MSYVESDREVVEKVTQEHPAGRPETREQGSQAQYEVVIEAGRTERHYWADLWRYRELFYFLSWRDILVRYKQTAIGITWSILRPFLTMIVFTVIFGKLGKMDSGGVPYPILVFAAMLPWQLFSGAFASSGISLVGNAQLISKIYFPRMIVPASAVIVNLVDFLISFALLAALMVWYRFAPGWRFCTLPAFLGLAMVVAFGAGLWVSALNVRYRDFQHVVPFVVQFGLYISPVGFSSNVVPERWRLLYSLNPMVGVIDGFRWAILGGNARIYWPGFTLSLVLTLLILVTGIRYFRKTEKTFADVI
ncbi:MAG: ABC transporter permease [Armatimonadetes bacterium]|nr:ABC transporter permease [Armatimonadota bacterium]